MGNGNDFSPSGSTLETGSLAWNVPSLNVGVEVVMINGLKLSKLGRD